MSYQNVEKLIEETKGHNLKVVINDNRSTMLSVRWEPDHTRVSMHRMFLEAPQNIMQSLACYIKGMEKQVSPEIKAFIEKNLRNLDYSHLLDAKKMSVQGNVYNLKNIFDHLNEEYFEKELSLNITWFGKPHTKPRSKLTFGLYYDPLKLIKINRLLDSPTIPYYMVSFVVYHEMLHHVCPAYVDQRGISHCHNEEFKKREAQFKDFSLTQQWLKDHTELLFA